MYVREEIIGMVICMSELFAKISISSRELMRFINDT